MNSDFKELLNLLGETQVKYLIVGGYAVILHSEPRYTKDLDIWVEASAQNAPLIFGALRAFGAPLSGLTTEDFEAEGYFYQMGSPPVRVDVLLSIPGLSFGAAWKNRVVADFDGVSANVLSKADLILAKRASGRPQDLIDVESLENAPG